MQRRTMAGLALVLFAVVTGCSASEGGAMRVSEALNVEGSRDVSGFLVVEGDGTYLCDELAESFPPQCGADRIEVVGLDLASIPDLRSAEGVSWTDGRITVRGRIESGILIVG